MRIEWRRQGPIDAGDFDVLADQRKAVGVDARRGDGDDGVARLDIGARQQRAALGGPDREARGVVVLVVVHARHLGRFAADQRAAGDAAALGDALDDRRAGRHIEPSGGEVVEEEQRLGTLDDDVVDAHRHEVDADGRVIAGVDGDLEFGADAVVGGYQDWIDETGRLEVEQPPETPDFGIGARSARRPNRRLDGLYQGISGIDVDARMLVG